MIYNGVEIPDGCEIEALTPQDGGQVRFFSSPAFECLGGGQAGGGKSWSLVSMALGNHGQDQKSIGVPYYKLPGYQAVLFRRQTTQLVNLLNEAHKSYPLLGGTYTAQRRGDPGPCYQFATDKENEPARIYFCHLENEDDKENHQGQQYQFAGFDELTQFTLTQYLYIFSRVRQIIHPDIITAVRGTTNPTGPGLWWVKKRFINNLTPDTISYFLADQDPKINPQGIKVPAGTKHALSREFIPMTLGENLKMMEADPNYASRIMQLGGQMAKALLGGDWDAFGGDFFKMFDYGREVIRPFDIPKAWRLYVSVDPGWAGTCAAVMIAVDLTGKVYLVSTYCERERNPEQNADGINTWWQTNKFTHGRRPLMFTCGLDAWSKKDRYAVEANERTFADVFRTKGLILQRAVTDRHNGWGACKALMPSRFFVFKDQNNPFLEELTAAVADEKDVDDIQGGGNDPEVVDHCLDAWRYDVMSANIPMEKPRKDGWAYHYGITQKAEDGRPAEWKPGMG